MNNQIVTPGRFRLIPMMPRDPSQKERPASTLELFFDLTFVVAVSIAAVNLHHSLSEAHIADGVLKYAFIFFAIWWAWMNFTWFATSFDTDDWLYRTLTVVQMGGVLVLAVGVAPAFEDNDFRLAVIGYVLMRVVMISQWLRASKNAGLMRQSTLFYAGGITVVQILWVCWLFVPGGMLPLILFPVLVIAEISVPIVAESRGNTPWHAHHITERYGLFTLILLGESLLASSNAVIEALAEGENIVRLVTLAVLVLIVTAAMWWIYFWPPHHRAITSLGGSLKYGYGHYFVFAAAGAFSAGVEVEIDSIMGNSKLDPVLATFMVSVPIAVFVLGIWLLAIRKNANAVVNTVVPLCAVLVLLDPIIPIPTFLTTFFMIIIVITLVLNPPTQDDSEDDSEEDAEVNVRDN